MISISEIHLVVIVQIILLLILLSVFLLFLLHRKNKKLQECSEGEHHESEVSPLASIQHYLTTEIKLTEARFNTLYKDEDRDVIEFVEPDWLILRKNYLDLEQELLNSSEREDEFWHGLGKKLRKLVSDSYLFKRIKAKESEDKEDGLGAENLDIMKLMKEQDDEYEMLISGLDNEDKEIENEELKEKLLKLSASHKELTYCIFVLEDENKFLQEQIKGLLDMDNK